MSSFQELKTSIGLTFMTGATAAPYEGKGLCVFHVKPNEPAAVAGVKEGDVITAVDGKPTKTQEQFTAIFETKRPGDKSEFKVLRKGKKVKLQIQFGAVGVKLKKALKLRAKAGVDSEDDGSGEEGEDDDEENKQGGGWLAWLGLGGQAEGSDSDSEEADSEPTKPPATTDAQLLAALGIAGHVTCNAEHVQNAQNFLRTIKPFIGLAMQESGPFLCITSVESGSPASSAGLAIGHAVTNINSKPVTGGAANFPSYWKEVRPGDVVAITTCELIGNPQKLGQSMVSRLVIAAQGLTTQQLDAVSALATATPGGVFPVRTEAWLRSAQQPEVPAYGASFGSGLGSSLGGIGGIGGIGNSAELRALVEDIARQRTASVNAHFLKLQQELDRERARMLAEVEQERAALLRKIG